MRTPLISSQVLIFKAELTRPISLANQILSGPKLLATSPPA
jgi:hypothetical protein